MQSYLKLQVMPKNSINHPYLKELYKPVIIKKELSKMHKIKIEILTKLIKFYQNKI